MEPKFHNGQTIFVKLSSDCSDGQYGIFKITDGYETKVYFKQKQMIICEGYMDCIMLHLAGIDNAVAVEVAIAAAHAPNASVAATQAVRRHRPQRTWLNCVSRLTNATTTSSKSWPSVCA